MKQINAIVNACIEKGYVTPEKAPWLHYALEKRITSAVIFIPLCAIGLLLTNAETLLSFYITFYLLRSLTNGWHAKTFLRCYICSIVGEVVFLGVLPDFWNPVLAKISTPTASILIWILAPFNDPNIGLTVDEAAECKRIVKRRLILLTLAITMLRFMKGTHLACGAELGILMTALTLLLAYIKKSWGDFWLKLH